VTAPTEKPPLEALAELRADIERELTGQDREDALHNIDDLMRAHREMDALVARHRRGGKIGRALSLLIGAPAGAWAVFQGIYFVITGDGTIAPWIVAALFVTAGGVILFVSVVHGFTGRDVSFMRIGIGSRQSGS
jgi:hypothetical protein